MERHRLWAQIAEASPFPPPGALIDNLERFRSWLVEEAVGAGGIGPGEVDRLDTRHIADSLLFSLVMEETSSVLDVGPGVGLPGIPLAILLPETGFTLLERSGRRVDLARRAVRILGLANVEVIQGDVTRWDRPVATVISRASLSPVDFRPILRSLLSPGGMAIVGGSWTSKPVVQGYQTQEIGSTFLDRSVWILIMRQT